MQREDSDMHSFVSCGRINTGCGTDFAGNRSGRKNEKCGCVVTGEGRLDAQTVMGKSTVVLLLWQKNIMRKSLHLQERCTGSESL